MPNRNKRIAWLIGTHIVLAAAPALSLLFDFSMQMLPLIWTLVALPIGGLMALSIWIGLGQTRLLWRVAIGLGASFYLTIWPFITDVVRFSESRSRSEWIMAYLEAVVPFSVALFLIGGTFMLLRLRFKVALVGPDAGPPSSERLQFSVLQLMVLMSVVAIVLSLLRATRAAELDSDSAWQSLVMNAFMFVIFFVNTACAAFAALGPRKVKRNVCLVLVVSILLGIATAIALRQVEIWWLFVGSMCMVVIPMATVVASLLVVRSCGYRLVRRSYGTQATGV